MPPKFHGVDFYADHRPVLRRGPVPETTDPGDGGAGPLGANLPEEYGCAGLDNVAYGLIMQELERGDSGVRSFTSMQGGLVMYPIFAFGYDAQKKTWLPQMASGKVIGCFGLTEPDYGSNPGGAAMACNDEAVSYARNRVMFGKPLGAFQLQQARSPKCSPRSPRRSCSASNWAA